MIFYSIKITCTYVKILNSNKVSCWNYTLLLKEDIKGSWRHTIASRNIFLGKLLNHMCKNLWWNVWQTKQIKERLSRPQGFFIHLLPSKHWEQFSMDFIADLSNSEGNNFIMVVVDRMKKYANFFSFSLILLKKVFS